MPPRPTTSIFAGPPVFWRAARRCLGLSVLCACIAVGTAIVRGNLPPRHRAAARYVVMSFGVAPVLVIYPIGYVLQRRLGRQWRRAGGRLCTWCAYDLSSLDASGTCPECGNAYDLEQDAATWSEVGFSTGDTPTNA
ncbi:MAG: hypothetical protein ACF8LK_03100 [Phycisphaerales bacterium JB041]